MRFLRTLWNTYPEVILGLGLILIAVALVGWAIVEVRS